MATVYETSVLASTSYGGSSPGPVPAGWKLLQTNDGKPLLRVNAKSGFEAVAYRNEVTGEIAVSYVGTNDWRDVFGTFPEIVSGNMPIAQFQQAVDFHNEVMRTVRDQYPGASVVLTGHSLGGLLAQAVSVVLRRMTGFAVPTVTFEAPGARSAIEKWLDKPIDGLTSQITNYVHPSDQIGSFRDHAGEVRYWGGIEGPGVGEAPWWAQILASPVLALGFVPSIFLTHKIPNAVEWFRDDPEGQRVIPGSAPPVQSSDSVSAVGVPFQVNSESSTVASGVVTNATSNWFDTLSAPSELGFVAPPTPPPVPAPVVLPSAPDLPTGDPSVPPPDPAPLPPDPVPPPTPDAPPDTQGVVMEIAQPPAVDASGSGDAAFSSASSAGASSDASTVSSATGAGASSDGNASTVGANGSSAAADAALAGHDGVAPIDTSSVVTDIVQPPAGGDGGGGGGAQRSLDEIAQTLLGTGFQIPSGGEAPPIQVNFNSLDEARQFVIEHPEFFQPRGGGAGDDVLDGGAGASSSPSSSGDSSDAGASPAGENGSSTAVDQLGTQAAHNDGESALIPEGATLVLSGVGSARTIASIVSSDLPDDQKALRSAAAAAGFTSQAVGTTTPLGEGLGAAGGALDVAAIALSDMPDEQKGLRSASAAASFASQAVGAETAAGQALGAVGGALSIAAIALSDMPDEQKAFSAAQTVITWAAPPLAIPSIVGFAVEELVNLGLGEYQQGDISKAIMKAKQTALFQYGNQAQEEALKSAPDFNATLRALSAGPPGTSGQVQFGVGNEYAGETLVGQAGTTQTPGWESTLQRISDPTVIAQHPDLVASFIQNLWVQTGPSGAAAFNPGATRNYQTFLLSKLPYTPEWNAARQKILNAEIVDPRDTAAREAALAAVPDLPADQYLRVGQAKLDTTHQYAFYNVWHVPPDVEPMPTEQAAMQLAQSYASYGSSARPQNPTLVMDLTTGKMLSQPVTGQIPQYMTGFEGQQVYAGYSVEVTTGYKLDSAYFDPQAPETPYTKSLRAEGERATAQVAQTDDWWRGTYGGGGDPVVLDLNEDGVLLQPAAKSGVDFDLNSDGFVERIAWVQPKDGLLALDRDGDGKITSGRELFSEFFDPDRATTGLGALALFDANHDGVIDAKDPVFGQLQVWQDANHDARTDQGDLRTLDALGISSIQLAGRPANEPVDGGRIITRATFIQNGTAKEAADMFFAAEGGSIRSAEAVDPIGETINLAAGAHEVDDMRVAQLRQAMAAFAPPTLSADMTLPSDIQHQLTPVLADASQSGHGHS